MTTPIFYYSLDAADTDPVTTKVATDGGGAGNNGTLVNYTSSGSLVTGHLNEGLSFVSSSSQRVTAPVTFASQDKTFAFWVKRPHVATQHNLIGRWYLSSTWGYYIYVSGSNELQITYRRAADSSDQTWNTFYNVPDNTWTFIAVVYDHTAGWTYYAGNTGGTPSGSTSAAGTLQESGNTFAIGALLDNVTWKYYLDGSMDEVYVFDSALSGADIDKLYNDTYLTFAYSIQATTASYTFTPIDVLLGNIYYLVADTAEYVVSSVSTTLLKWMHLTTAAVSYSVSIFANRIGRTFIEKFQSVAYSVLPGWHSPKPDFAVKRKRNKWWLKLVHRR